MSWRPVYAGRAKSSHLVYVIELVRELVVRDLKIRYKRSYLGIAWSLVTPAVQVVLFSFVFTRVLPLEIPNYTLFLFIGVLSWTWFATALNSSAGAIISNPGLVRRPGFPVAALPVISVTSSGVHFLFAMPLLLAFSAAATAHPGLELLSLPIVVAVQFTLSASLAFAIAASNVRFRDTQHLVSLLLMVGFYLTPVFYSARIIPEEYKFLETANPMALILRAYRDIFLENSWPDFGSLLLVSIVAAILLWISFRAFLRASVRFAEEL